MLTLAQRRALAYAPKPSAALSFVSSLYVIYTLTRRTPSKLKRMYHRLILGMCINILPQSLAFFWGTWAMPEGTEGVVAASGTTATCTAQGFMVATFAFTVPFYYASLSLYSYVAVRNNFREERYKWMEKYLHCGAYVLPLTSAVTMTIRGYLNPSGPWCFINAYPRGCNKNPNVDCIRGDEHVQTYSWIFAFGQNAVYLVFATSMMIALVWYVNRASSKSSEMQSGLGKRKIVERLRRGRTRAAASQAGLYLAAYYVAYVFPLFTRCYERATGRMIFGTMVVGQCLVPLQGFLVTLVYFRLQRIERRSEERIVRESLTETIGGGGGGIGGGGEHGGGGVRASNDTAGSTQLYVHNAQRRDSYSATGGGLASVVASVVSACGGAASAGGNSSTVTVTRSGAHGHAQHGSQHSRHGGGHGSQHGGQGGIENTARSSYCSVSDIRRSALLTMEGIRRASQTEDDRGATAAGAGPRNRGGGAGGGQRPSREPRDMEVAFCIFDGTPDEDSPWAKYLNEDEEDDYDDDNGTDGGGTGLRGVDDDIERQRDRSNKNENYDEKGKQEEEEEDFGSNWNVTPAKRRTSNNSKRRFSKRLSQTTIRRLSKTKRRISSAGSDTLRAIVDRFRDEEGADPDEDSDNGDCDEKWSKQRTERTLRVGSGGGAEEDLSLMGDNATCATCTFDEGTNHNRRRSSGDTLDEGTSHTRQRSSGMDEHNNGKTFSMDEYEIHHGEGEEDKFEDNIGEEGSAPVGTTGTNGRAAAGSSGSK